jgi:hypothetical protein
VDAEFAQRLAEYRATHPRTHMLFVGATVYRSKDSPPRTLVRYWPEGNGAASHSGPPPTSPSSPEASTRSWIPPATVIIS